MEKINNIISEIDSYEPEAFRRQMELHQQDMGSLEDGHATERVLERIIGRISSK